MLDTIHELSRKLIHYQNRTVIGTVWENHEYVDKLTNLFNTLKHTLKSIEVIYRESNESPRIMNPMILEGFYSIEVLCKMLFACKLAAKMYYFLDIESVDETLPTKFVELMSISHCAQYLTIIAIYDKLFSAEDMLNAERYFNNHPQEVFAGSAQGLMYSYLKTSEGLSRRGYYIGSGHYFAAKTVYQPLSPLSATNKIIKQSERYVSSAEKRIAEINSEIGILFDLGIIQTEHSKAIIRMKNQAVYKIYQELPYLGLTLKHILEGQFPTFNIRMKYAIDLLLKVDDLHAGRLSISGKRYAHKDIKPSNITVNNENRICLIDFQFSQVVTQEDSHTPRQGTPDYLPVDYDILTQALNMKRIDYSFIFKHIHITPSYFFDDKIAVLRTIYSPILPLRLLKKEEYANMPLCIRLILDTASIKSCIQNHWQHSLKAIAASLILYHTHPNYCSETNVSLMISHEHMQDECIEKYQQSPEMAHDFLDSLFSNQTIGDIPTPNRSYENLSIFSTVNSQCQRVPTPYSPEMEGGKISY